MGFWRMGSNSSSTAQLVQEVVSLDLRQQHYRSQTALPPTKLSWTQGTISLRLHSRSVGTLMFHLTRNSLAMSLQILKRAIEVLD